eukprot:1649137-Ditylum_brightwellii.AAC.1
MAKDDEERTALHCVCLKRKSIETERQAVVEDSPQVANEAGNLQFASSTNCPSIKVVSLLLERYPLAVTEEDDDSNTPLDYWNEHHSPEHDEDIATILYGIENLHHDNLDPSIALLIIKEFIHIGWLAGVALAFDLYPFPVEMLKSIPMSAIPTLLSMLGRRCKKLTMWNVIIERQDILKIN